jgi:signal transduction histidine kinase
VDATLIAVTMVMIAGLAVVVAVQYRQAVGQQLILRQATDAARRSDQQHRETMVALIEAVRALQPAPPEIAAVTATEAPGTEPAPELTDSNIVQELTHSLRTPLHAIRYETEAIELTHLDDESLRDQCGQIGRFVETCDVFLSVFGQVVDAARRTERLRDAPLPETIRTLHAAAEAAHQRGTKLILLGVPELVADYQNTYLAALLMPLIENAVEASEPAGEITVEYQPEPGYATLRCANAVPPGTELPAPGFSTKHPGPGLGLKVAERLADMHRGGRVDIALQDGRALVVVRLPDTRGEI